MMLSIAGNDALHRYGDVAYAPADQGACRPLDSSIYQGKSDEALPLLERAFVIRPKAFGETHENTVESQILSCG